MTRIWIYKITNLVTQKMYVGVTSRDIEYRWKMHQYQNGCRRLSNSIKKHGAENFKIEEIYVCFDYDHANEMEDYFIKFYNTLSPNGYNLREGGRFGKVTEETREILRVTQNKNWESEERRDYYSDMLKERWASGKNESALSGIKIYIENKKSAVIGFNIKTKEVKKFLSICEGELIYSNIGGCISGKIKTAHGFCWFEDIGQTREELELLSKEIISSKKSNWKNLPGKDDRLQKMRSGSSHRFKPIVSVSIITGEVKFYENIHDAIRAGFSTSSIYSCLNGKTKTGQKFCWFRKTQDNNEYYIDLAKKLIGQFKSKNITP